MPSIQWGATSTAMLVFTPVSSALGGLSSAAGTIAIVWKPNGVSDGAGLLNSAGSNWYHAHEQNGKWQDDDGLVNILSTTAPTATDWHISAVDWPTNASPAVERFHWADLSTAGAWNHENSAVNNGGNKAGPGTTGFLRIGDLLDNHVTSGMQIALVGVWNVALGDTNAALLSTNKKTSDWYNNPAGKPIFLCEVTSLTPTDLIGGSTFSAGNSTTTGLTVGGDPAGGWTFDGTGAAASPFGSPNLPFMTPQGVTF